MDAGRTANVIKNSVASLVLKLVGILSQFALRTAFIYLLGNEYTGVSGLFTDILSVLSLMEMGLDVSMVYALYKPLAENDHSKISALMNFYKKAYRIIGVSVLLLGLICVPFLGYIVKGTANIKESLAGIFMMYVVTTAVSYLCVYRTILLKADQKSRIISKWTAVIQLIEIVVEVGLLLLLKEFYAYLVTHLVATVAINVTLSLIATKAYPQYFNDKTAKLEKGETKMLFQDLLYLTAYNLSGVVINSTDSIFISAFVGAAEVAIIGNYSLIVNSIRTCVTQIVSATKPSIGNLAATSTYEKQEDIFHKMDFIAFYVCCVCCACLFCLLTPFISNVWFGPAYEVAMPIVAVLCVNFYIAVMVLPVESFRTANGLFKQGWARPIIMASMNIVLNFILGAKWGIMGIFLATTISRVFTQVWFDAYLVYKYVFASKPFAYLKTFAIRFVIAVLICGITAAVCAFIPTVNVSIIDFALRALVVVVVSNALLLLIYHKNENLQYMFGMVMGKVKRK